MTQNRPHRVCRVASICALSACLLLLGMSAAVAQYVAGGRAPYYGNGGYGGWGYGNNYGAGTTPAGSYMAGMASAIRAQGQYNLMSSEAAINLEEAKKKDTENRVQWTNAYFEMRKINEAYKQASKGPPTTPETWARLAQAQAPARLSSSTLDQVTGEINWPTLLKGNEFKADREVLDQLFGERALQHGAIGPDAHAKIRAAVDEALATLKTHIRQVDSRSYLDARNFLTSLANEASYPTG